MSIFADTLELCLATRQEQRRLKSRSKRLAQKSLKKLASKSTASSEAVPF
jgi:hypothetical protein